jgi:hypothetical protein
MEKLMLDFLVKIATYLDTKGHHKLAKELDTLLEKMGQMNELPGPGEIRQNPNTGKQAPLQQNIAPAKAPTEPKNLASVLFNVQDAVDKGQAKAPGKSMSLAGDILSDIQNEMAITPQSPQIKSLVAELEKILGSIVEQANDNDPKMALWESAANKASEVLNLMSGQKAPVKHKPNLLVMRIQQNIGVKADGFWGKDTNAKFIAVMSSLPEYAKFIVNGKFNGTLQDAVRYTDAIQAYNEKTTHPDAPEEEAPKPVAKAPVARNWKSKFHQMTPAAMGYLERFEKMRPGEAQTALDAIDKVPSQTQVDFESTLKDMAESAEDTSGEGRLNDSYRRK